MFRSPLLSLCVVAALFLSPSILFAQDGSGDDGFGTVTGFQSSTGATVTFQMPDAGEIYRLQGELFTRTRSLEIAILDLYRATRHSSKVGDDETKLDLELHRLTALDGYVDLTMPIPETRFYNSFNTPYEQADGHIFATGGDDAQKLEALRNEVERRLQDTRNVAQALSVIYQNCVQVTGLELPTGEAVEDLVRDLQASYPNLGQMINASPVIGAFRILLHQYDEIVELFTRMNLYGLWIRRHRIANGDGDHARSLLTGGFGGFEVLAMPPIHLVASLTLTTGSNTTIEGNVATYETNELAEMLLEAQDLAEQDAAWIRNFIAPRAGNDGRPETWNLFTADGKIALIDYEMDQIVASRDGTKDDGQTDNMHDDGTAFRRAVLSCGDFLINWVHLTSQMNRLRWLCLYPVYQLSSLDGTDVENWIAVRSQDMASRYDRYFDGDQRVRWDDATGFFGFGGLRGVHWASYLSHLTDDKAEDWFFLADDFNEIITGVAVAVQRN